MVTIQKKVQTSAPVCVPSEREFCKLWQDFNAFYMLVIEGNSKALLAVKKKHKDLLTAPPLATHLGEMSKLIPSKIVDRMLRIEDKENRKTKTVGECLEFMLRERLIEAICAYALTDNPPGFFKYALNILSELFQAIKSTPILTQSSVHPAIN